jgi:nucleotide-binding universal stress UspA family protein
MSHSVSHAFDRFETEVVIHEFRRILVPLDGSPFAERAVQHATELATAARGSVVLVRAADRSHHPRPGQPNDGDGQAQAYLEEVRHQLQRTGVSAEVAAPHGHAPESLLAEIAHQEPELIVMTTHSRSGLRHAAIDSVAEAVVASGQAPVLLLRQDAVDGEPRFSSHVGGRVLALLDGSAFAETALPAALGLARVLESELILFKAIDVYSVPYAVPTELMTVPDLDVQLAWDGSFDVKEAEAYLSLVRRRLKGHAPETPVQITGPGRRPHRAGSRAGIPS